MKKNIVITSVNKRYGNFFVKHWLRSLKDTVNLNQLDVIVIDYGLTFEQKAQIKGSLIKIIQGSNTGHIVTQRFIDTIDILEKSNYEQVLFVDGGDMIFQEDISFLFNQDKEYFRAVPLDTEVLFYEAFIPFNFERQMGKEIYKFLKDKPILNAGFILGQRKKFIKLCKEIKKLIINKRAYGPDQVALNYFLYQEKVKILNRKYNYMINTASEGFFIRDGIFYLKSGEKIAVVHNAGHNGFLRPIINFGYGKKYNQINYFMYYLHRLHYQTIGGIKKLIQKIKH